ncbi:hypothetical protein DFA_02641 [Cavenderia fasciculata]|uniref:Lipoprotein n=1 Tax=Cavenderia fasciculata TaxID=261658 RepID=F4PZY8_CACFS|nr:uncharacterized protein DFA_02641 [Cavenderia fasciculata]EGG18902.1 hypothetical protein DFA_02641 [Cavenderia fasciculata]|eukprot:XP_004357364.1 hypothetical protein DFA_02641 [Cavenderia fasciculata]
MKSILFITLIALTIFISTCSSYPTSLVQGDYNVFWTDQVCTSSGVTTVSRNEDGYQANFTMPTALPIRLVNITVGYDGSLSGLGAIYLNGDMSFTQIKGVITQFGAFTVTYVPNGPYFTRPITAYYLLTTCKSISSNVDQEQYTANFNNNNGQYSPY